MSVPVLVPILDFKDRFCGAIHMDCGQNVGPDCSFKARAGLWFLKLLSKSMSNASLMSSFKDVTAKSPADWKLVESTFGAGMFFDSAEDQVNVLHSVQPANHIPNLDFPILFFNGSEDYRDSEDRWLSLCKVQEGSSLKVFEGGDHFFTHDSRFVFEMLDMMDKFAKDRLG
jgi:surfactin synthase thioesterase subunit